MNSDDANTQLEGFFAKYLPEIAMTGRDGTARLRALLPECDALVYDNYNALAIGFSPDGRTAMNILSLALYPRWASLFVSASLDDPHGVLRGSGGSIRHVVLAGGAMDIDRPEVAALIAQSRARAGTMIDPTRRGQLIIKSVAAKQKPRRPNA